MGTTASTLITVDPEVFLDGTPCGSYEGAMRTYVATLTDVSVDPPFRLAASSPVACQLAVSFAYIVPGHGYVASIDAYDREDLVPLGGASSGSPIMLDRVTKERVFPTWTTECGKGDPTEGDAGAQKELSPTFAKSFRDVRVHGCKPLERKEPAKEARISIELPRGELSCGGAEGQIERYAVIPNDASLAPLETSCEQSLTFDVPPGRLDGFVLSAFEAGKTEPRWTARCEATSVAGTTLPASCTPLSSRGTIRVTMDELLKAHGHSCSPDDIESYDLLLRDQVIASAVSCNDDAIAGPLDPGSYELSVVGLGREGGKFTPKLTAHCPAIEVAVGRQASTNCAP